MPTTDYACLLRDELTSVDTAIQAGLELPDARAETGAVALVLLRQIVVNAEAILALAKTQVAEAAVTNLRTLFEAWLQLIYLFRCVPDSELAAVVCQAFAILEFRDWLVEQKAAASEIDPINQALQDLRSRHPSGVKAAEDIRSGAAKVQNNNYWSGIGPTALVRKVSATLPDPTQGPKFYKFTSWDAHVIMAPILDLQRTSRNGALHLELAPRQPPSEAGEAYCRPAFELLRQSWAVVRTQLPLTVRVPSEPPLKARPWWAFWRK